MSFKVETCACCTGTVEADSRFYVESGKICRACYEIRTADQ